VANKNFIVKNGVTVGNIVLQASDGSITANSANLSGNLSVSGITNVGPISNLYVTGGSTGQVIVTDGQGNLSFSSPSVTVAPMPAYIFSGTSVNVPEFYQALSGLSTLEVDGNLIVDGVYIEA